MKIFDWPRQESAIEAFFKRSQSPPANVSHSVDRIIESVRREGDRAVSRFTRQFDGVALQPSQFEVSREELKKAWEKTPAFLRSALKLAAKRIEAFHKRQRLKGWSVNDPQLGRMEWRVAAVERAGVYAPGGRAAYPSTVLMDVIPAKVAGVREVILVTPAGRDGSLNPNVLAAAYLAGADRLFRIGGAQAIAALAYGTETIPRVDKIVGPGNIYVATAKQKLFGVVDIDGIAGPTEVLILADNSARLDWIAADMLAQAEHDPDASSGAILIGGTNERAQELSAEIQRQLQSLSRKAIALNSIRRNGYIILTPDADSAVEIADLKAPEHIEILASGARKLAAKIRHAGAIFIGAHTPEPVGDYIAGPNHTLPTGGTARFFSPLSVRSFYKSCQTIEATPSGLARHADAIRTLAQSEGLTGHAQSVAVRFSPRKKG